jgi:hypothetical protein
MSAALRRVIRGLLVEAAALGLAPAEREAILEDARGALSGLPSSERVLWVDDSSEPAVARLRDAGVAALALGLELGDRKSVV